MILLVSSAMVVFSVISLITAPVINRVLSKEIIKDWATHNCQKLADDEKDSTNLNEKYQLHKEKTLCERKKAVFSLEYASFIFDLSFGFFLSLLSFLQYYNMGKDFKKNTGIFGIITGSIGFIFTFIYFIYSSYVFTNDSAYAPEKSIIKLFSNGAKYKYVEEGTTGKYISAYEGETDEDSNLIKYNDLGKKQYNYDSQHYKVFYQEYELEEGNNCLSDKFTNGIYSTPKGHDCYYLYDYPFTDKKNKYLYDQWTTTLIFAFFICICNIFLVIFGALLFKGGEKRG